MKTEFDCENNVNVEFPRRCLPRMNSWVGGVAVLCVTSMLCVYSYTTQFPTLAPRQVDSHVSPSTSSSSLTLPVSSSLSSSNNFDDDTLHKNYNIKNRSPGSGSSITSRRPTTTLSAPNHATSGHHDDGEAPSSLLAIPHVSVNATIPPQVLSFQQLQQHSPLTRDETREGAVNPAGRYSDTKEGTFSSSVSSSRDNFLLRPSVCGGRSRLSLVMCVVVARGGVSERTTVRETWGAVGR